MEEVLTYKQISRYDPTNTTVLRNAFSRDMKRRFQELIKVIRISVVDQDCFGLSRDGFILHQVTPPIGGAFDFLLDPGKIEAFMRWLSSQEGKSILSTTEMQQIGRGLNGAWINRYVLEAYKRGILKARQALIRAGYTITPTQDFEGVQALLGSSFHMDRLGLLYIRAFSTLQGITSQMDAQISQILTQGIMSGEGSLLIARKIIAAIDGTGMGTLGITDTLGRFIPAERRALMLAKTEVIRAFHLATIQEYRNWGVEGVTVMAEWTTAGDDKVCPNCHTLEGKIFTLDEIEPMIPFHPNCRCIALPYIENKK